MAPESNKKIDLKREILLKTPAPVLPDGLSRLLQAFEADHIDHLKLAEIIADYPSIAGRLLFLANSAWISPRVPIENLQTACARLGFSMVRNVSISLCIVSPFNTFKKCPAFDIEYFWCSALLTAEGSAMLASALPPATDLNIPTLHTAGLLHNLGLLWLAGNWPEEISQALRLAREDDSLSTVEALHAVIGTDYCETGGKLGRAWKLPEVLVSAMENHYCDNYTATEMRSTLLVGYASLMVSSLQRGLERRPPFPKNTGIHLEPSTLNGIYLKLHEKLKESRKLAHSIFTG